MKKRPLYKVEANALLQDLKTQLHIDTIRDLDIVHCYDVEGVDDAIFLQGVSTILSEVMVDDVYYDESFMNGKDRKSVV